MDYKCGPLPEKTFDPSMQPSDAEQKALDIYEQQIAIENKFTGDKLVASYEEVIPYEHNFVWNVLLQTQYLLYFRIFR